MEKILNKILKKVENIEAKVKDLKQGQDKIVHNVELLKYDVRTLKKGQGRIEHNVKEINNIDNIWMDIGILDKKYNEKILNDKKVIKI